jgi:hypothetical protein
MFEMFGQLDIWIHSAPASLGAPNLDSAEIISLTL